MAALDVRTWDTVLRMADWRRNRDPLPLVWLYGTARIRSDRLALWQRRKAKDRGLVCVCGARALCAALGIKSAQTLARWAERTWAPRVPIQRDAEGLLWAYQSALEDWVQAEHTPHWRRARDLRAKGDRRLRPEATGDEPQMRQDERADDAAGAMDARERGAPAAAVRTRTSEDGRRSEANGGRKIGNDRRPVRLAASNAEAQRPRAMSFPFRRRAPGATVRTKS